MEPQRIGTIVAPMAPVPASTPKTAEPSRESYERARLAEFHFGAFKRAGYPRRHCELISAAWKKADEAQRKGFLLDPPPGAAEIREQAFQAISQPGGCVLLLGQRGTGKTQLACELGLRIASNEVLTAPPPHHVGSDSTPQRYEVLADLFALEKASWKNHDSKTPGPLMQIREVEYLVLDEIQERTESQWEDGELVRLFDYRYRDMKRTVLIANLDVAGFRQKMPASIWSRVLETGTVVECNWSSFRGRM